MGTTAVFRPLSCFQNSLSPTVGHYEAPPTLPLVLSGIVLEVCAIVKLTRPWRHAGHFLPGTSLEAGVLELLTGLGRR